MFGGSLVNLVNNQWFTKLKPCKLMVTVSNLLADLYIHSPNILSKVFIHPHSPNIITTKLSCYMVMYIIVIEIAHNKSLSWWCGLKWGLIALNMSQNVAKPMPGIPQKQVSTNVDPLAIGQLQKLTHCRVHYRS